MKYMPIYTSTWKKRLNKQAVTTYKYRCTNAQVKLRALNALIITHVAWGGGEGEGGARSNYPSLRNNIRNGHNMSRLVLLLPEFCAENTAHVVHHCDMQRNLGCYY